MAYLVCSSPPAQGGAEVRPFEAEHGPCKFQPLIFGTMVKIPLANRHQYAK
jgi:hypothetical protein